MKVENSVDVCCQGAVTGVAVVAYCDTLAKMLSILAP